MAPMLAASSAATLLSRIDRLRPETRPRWGRMTAGQMVCHLGDQLRVALGELETRPIAGPLRYTPIKHLAIYVLPWPKGRIKAAPEMQSTPARAWERDVETLRTLLRRFATREAGGAWPAHPSFGTMSRRLWGHLVRRHFDHHLTQFTV